VGKEWVRRRKGFSVFSKMGSTISTTDFHWSYTDEPHATRRKEMLEKYPHIKDLFGHDKGTKYVVLFWVLSQVIISHIMADASWYMLLLVAYCFGGVANHALTLAIHEISHNLAFESQLYNKFLAIFANLPIAFPHFSMFQKYHMEHHQYQGSDGIDVDIPSRWEGEIFTNPLMKLIWIFFQPVFYVTRPLFIKPKKPGFWEAVNWSVCLGFDLLIYYYWGGKSLSYLFLSSFLGTGLHPVAGHFIAEHYVFVKGYETYSYYGPLNLVSFNVGYHNEHHDFPRIPGSRLPILRKIAPDYYDTLPSHSSWVRVMWDYITDPSIVHFLA